MEILNKQGKSLNPVVLNVIVGSSILLISLVPSTLNFNQTWIRPEIHSSLEGIDAIMCFILSLFLVNSNYYKSDYPVLFLLSAMFFIRGLGDILHSFLEPNNLFIFYHSFGSFFAGAIAPFIFFLRPLQWFSNLKYSYLLMVVFSLIIYGLFIAFPGLVPPIGNEYEFSTESVAMNLIAGCSFLLLTIKLIQIQIGKKSEHNYTNYSLIFMIFSVSNFTFYGSALWDVSWWMWHFYTFIITGLVIYSVISYQKSLIIRLNDSKTELEKFQASLLQSKEVLESKNKELEQFTYITSHDLQEPLNSILSFSSLLKGSDGSKLDKIGKQSVAIIEESAIRMKQFIISLLEYSRIGRIKVKSDVNIAQMLNDLKTDLNDLTQREDATVTYIGQDITISAYKTDLIKLFQNLIVNGIKYRKEEERPFIVINGKELENEYEFSVTDNGIGIEQQYFDQIFEVFRRLHTNDQYSGTGIGLAHCKKIVELHHGNIWLESTPDKGSKFYFTISKS